MHAFALPGLSQMPCENATSTPVLLFCTDAGWLCISSLWSIMWGVRGSLVVKHVLFYFTLPTPSFCSPSPDSWVRGSGGSRGSSWKNWGRVGEGIK